MRDQTAIERTVIITFQPRAVSELALAAIGYKFADLDPERIIVVAECATPQCLVFADGLLAVRKIAALARGETDAGVPLLLPM